jgi:hypothetical protein
MGDAAGLGFRAHSGWAVVVAVAGGGEAAKAVLRRRLHMSRRTPRQPYHAAEGRPFPAAQALVGRAAQEASALAARELADVMVELKGMGLEPVRARILTSAGRALPVLRDVLASHALIHAAEGELFREALRQAARGAGLEVADIKERDLDASAARSLGASDAAIRARIATWGKALGAPWTQDEKKAALAAWISLTGPSPP